MLAPSKHSRAGVLGGVATLLFAACTPRAPTAARPVYAYVITPPPAGSWQLKVEATFEEAPSERLVAPDDAASIHDVALLQGGAGARLLTRDGDAWVVPACRTRCTLRYTIDLDALASSCHRMDCERRVGDAILGRASSFMLLPKPMGDATLRMSAVGTDVDRFATGLRHAPGGGYVLATRELGEASFTAFGALRHGGLYVPGARGRAHIDVALLGPPLAMGDAATVDFVAESAAAVAGLFERFPVDATVFVVPVQAANTVVFGRVMSLAGASVALLVGDATPASRVHDEWVVVHELFHLGTPSFVGEGHWLEEGLATYYEPILRERAGWMTEAALWSHFVREMPRGLRGAADAAGLEDREDIDATYWGGALFALLADVRIRTESGGSRSLDDVVRAVLDREGDATHAARVGDFLRVGEEVAGNRALSSVFASWALRGENPDLAELWQKLGIEGGDPIRDNGQPVTLHDDAPMASTRRAIAAAYHF